MAALASPVAATPAARHDHVCRRSCLSQTNRSNPQKPTAPTLVGRRWEKAGAVAPVGAEQMQQSIVLWRRSRSVLHNAFMVIFFSEYGCRPEAIASLIMARRGDPYGPLLTWRCASHSTKAPRSQTLDRADGWRPLSIHRGGYRRTQRLPCRSTTPSPACQQRRSASRSG
jgi:hypothetical protein